MPISIESDGDKMSMGNEGSGITYLTMYYFQFLVDIEFQMI